MGKVSLRDNLKFDDSLITERSPAPKEPDVSEAGDHNRASLVGVSLRKGGRGVHVWGEGFQGVSGATSR